MPFFIRVTQTSDAMPRLIGAAQKLLGIEREQLPIIWDCDFLLGPKDDAGNDSYVLCEINVSSVAPYPESAVPFMVEATLDRLCART